MEAQRTLIFVLLSAHCLYVTPLSLRTTVPTTTVTETTTPVPPTLPESSATTPQIIYDTYCMISSPCKNGGTCVDVEGHDYYCTCEYDFTGKNCEVQVTTTGPKTTIPDTTTSVPPTSPMSTATTPKIYYDTYCMLWSPCKNGGTCVDVESYNNYYCTCEPDFTGKDCEVQVTTPAPTTTVPDTTTVTTPGVHVSTTPVTTMNTPSSTPKISEGDTICFLYAPCKNGGTCVEENTAEGYSCDCPTGYTGKNCEETEETEGTKDVIVSDDKCPRKVVVALQHRPIKYMARLNCADGKIRVISAEYGAGIYWNNGMPQVTKICNNKTKCKVPAKDRIFGDPYKGVYKKLIIVYECLKHLHSYRY